MDKEDGMNRLEPSGWAEPATTGGTEDDFAPASLRCPHCGLFYRKDLWEIEVRGTRREPEFVLWCKCSNCGGYIERAER